MTRVVVQNYDELNKLPIGKDLEIVVQSSGFIYQFKRDHWEFVGRAV